MKKPTPTPLPNFSLAETLIANLLLATNPDRDRFGGKSLVEINETLSRNSLVSVQEIRKACDDLCTRGLLSIRQGTSPRIALTNELYEMYNQRIHGWDSEKDAAVILAAVDRYISTLGLAKALGWPPARINPPLRRLLDGDLVNASKTIPGTLPFWRVSVWPKS